MAGAIFRTAPVAPRNVNDVSYVTRFNHESHFYVAGAVFSAVGSSLSVAGATFDVAVSRFVQAQPW